MLRLRDMQHRRTPEIQVMSLDILLRRASVVTPLSKMKSMYLCTTVLL